MWKQRRGNVNNVPNSDNYKPHQNHDLFWGNQEGGKKEGRLNNDHLSSYLLNAKGRHFCFLFILQNWTLFLYGKTENIIKIKPVFKKAAPEVSTFCLSRVMSPWTQGSKRMRAFCSSYFPIFISRVKTPGGTKPGQKSRNPRPCDPGRETCMPLALKLPACRWV